MHVSRIPARLRTGALAVVSTALLVIQVAAAPAGGSIAAVPSLPETQASLPAVSLASATPTPSSVSAPAPSTTTSTASQPAAATSAPVTRVTAAAPAPAGPSSTPASVSPSPADPVATAMATQATAQPTTRGQSSSSPSASAAPTTAPKYAGWSADWVDDFNVPIDQTQWTAYGWGYQVPGQGAMGRYLVSNTFTSNGVMTLRTQYQNGEWSSAGVSSGDFYAVSGGRWEIRAKFPQAKGIGYAFLLYPDDGSWPPEFDFAEGRVNGPEIDATYHWGSQNYQDLSILNNADMHSWHTYGVIIGTNTITWTFDGQPWKTITNNSVTTKKMWIGFQCGAMDPNGSANMYETVDNGVPGPLTPAVNDIQIDWVAHYTKA